MTVAIAGSARHFPGVNAPGVGFEDPFAMLQACHERVQRTLALLERLHRIETRCGRTRPVPERPGYQDRTLDLDLLFFDDRVIHTGALILPHPRMHERLFVLAPLAEIAPAMVHPLLCRPVAGLLQDLQQADPDQRVERLRWPEPPCIRL